MMISLFNNFFPPEVLTYVSNITVNFNFTKDEKGLTESQRIFLSKEIGSEITKVNNIKQVHGDNIVCVTNDSFSNDSVIEADGQLTEEINIPLVVRTADCLPIFICDYQRKCVGIIHAGWKSTKKGIAKKAISLFQKKWGCKPEDIKCSFGPSIKSCCYEVGEEFLDFFPGEVIKMGNNNFLDLSRVNKKQLFNAGVKEENIMDCNLCTCCNGNYHSYRRDGDRAGRMISLIMIKSI